VTVIEASRDRMRSRGQLLRVTTRATAVLLLSLMSATASTAAAAPPASHAKPCDEHTGSIRKLVRNARLIRGPVAKRLRFRLALFDLKHRSNLLSRATLPPPRDDDQAIQNDLPATQIAADPFIELRRLGLFVEVVDPHPFTRSSSPRSPRGPPAHA